MSLSTIDEIVEQLKSMPQHLQYQVLEFAQKLLKTEVRGISGKQLLPQNSCIKPPLLRG
ncbi:MAG: hypothetical protein F6K54_00035 [Okeania sp. SIO3B5]|uniref:hypothetical protein n=1 Tax=Okeania sp. SIO3B5 TaxID=2607811 RepID=UPI0013FEF425|nr:hypothetical protein [Okeania sp. SIO3B5]NEO51626.1 hypothetical protein [Okeania sp. SIO3B5]